MSSVLLFGWAIRATLLLAVALPLVWCIERRSAAIAHRLLATVSLCILIVLPVCMIVAPGWHCAIPLSRVAKTIGFQTDSNRDTAHSVPFAQRAAFNAESDPSPVATVDASNRFQSHSGNGPLSHVADERPAQGFPENRAATSNQGAAPGNLPIVKDPRDSTNWLQVMAVVWMAVGGILVLRLVSSIRRLRRAVMCCRIAPPVLSQQLQDLSAKCGLNRPAQLLLSKRNTMPMACWLGRWVIVVPEDFDSWPDPLREVTLLHELGHVVRRDAWVDYLALCVTCLLWPNPIAWFAAADTRRLRERACDEWSLSRYSGGARHYGLSLIEVVRRCQQTEFRIAGAIGEAHSLESRLRWLFSCPTSRNYWSVLSMPVVVMTLGLAVAIATADPTDVSRENGGQGSTPEAVAVVVSREPSPRTPVISVRGMVKDQGGNPIAGASVVLRANLGGVQYVMGLQHARDVLAKTKTDSRGQFLFSGIGLPPRLVDVINDLRQGKPGVQVLAWSEGSSLQWKPVKSFHEAELEFRLPNEAEVNGVVLNENGTPLADGQLTVTGFTKATGENMLLNAPGDLNTIRSEVRFSGTIRDGRFSLANMPGDYRIYVRVGSRSGHRQFFVIDTGSGASQETLNQRDTENSVMMYRTPVRVTAKRQPWVQVRIVSDRGIPVAGGGVEAIDSKGQYGGEAAVGDDGVAILSVNRAGVHKVRYSGDPLSPALGLVDQVDIQPDNRGIVELRLPASRTLAGKVVDSDTGEPVPGVYVYGYNREAGAAQPRTSSMAVSGVDGRFKLPAAMGECAFSIVHDVDGYFIPNHHNMPDGLPAPEIPTVMVTAENALADVLIKVSRGLVVDGTVVDRQGVPARGIRVSGTCNGRPHRQTTTVTDADGRYRLATLSPYVPIRIVARSDAGIAEEIIPPTKDHSWPETLTKTVNLQLDPGTCIVGRLTQAGRAVPGISVRLHRAEPAKPDEKGYGLAAWDETTTDEQGKYRLTGLRKGDRFCLEVEAQEGVEVRDWDYMSPHLHTVDVADGETLELPDAELVTNGQSLSRVVVDPDGRPVAGITVGARLASGRHLSQPQGRRNSPPWTITDDKGRFKLTYLPDEPISLMAYKANPAGGQILHPSHADPEINANNIRIVFDPSLREEPETLD